MLREVREKYEPVFVVHGDFIACDLRAHFAAMMVTLGRIFDSKRKTIGIPELLRQFSQFEQVANNKWQHVQQLWNEEKICILRHQVIAHR